MLLAGVANCNMVTRLWAVLQSMTIRTTVETARIILIFLAARETRQVMLQIHVKV